MTGQGPLDDADHHPHILARARDLARVLALVFDLARDRDLDRDLDRDRVLALARYLASALDRDRARDRARARASHLASARDHASALASALDRDRARDRDLFRQVLRQINTFIDQWEQLDASAKAKPAPVARSAERLVDVAMRLLPARHRGRYAEEFKAELHGLAQAKATSTVQVVYMLQQLGRVWRTRESLLRPDLPRFHRLHRAACWVLASNRRTWWPLGSLLTLAAVNIHLSQGWGSAFYTLLGIVGFHSGVEWLRRRWGIELKPKLSAGDPGGDQ